MKEYNFACEIVKVDLSVGTTYSSLKTIKRANETGWGTFTSRPNHSKTYKVYNRYLESYNFSGCLVFYCINVYTFRPIDICFISRLKPRQPNPTHRYRV